MSANPARQMLSAKQRLDSGALALLHARYSDVDTDAARDLMRIWWELDAVRFELAGANERTLQARAERQKAEDQIYQLNSRLPGAGRAL